jgi:DNA-binding transcriptional LysR family regulator
MYSRHLYSHELLRTLVAIVDTGGFAKAAAQLHCTQAAVSLQVRRLEEHAEQALFEKSGRQMLITDAGLLLVDYARRILALNLEATHALQGRRIDGTLRLGAPQDVAEDHLPEVLRQFSSVFPRVRLEVRVERNVQIMHGIQRGEYDVAVALSDDEMKWDATKAGKLEKLGQAKMLWLAAQQLAPLAADEPIPLVLLEHPCIFRTHAVAALEAAKVSYRVAYTTTSLSGLRAAVEAGLGITARMLTQRDEERNIAPLAAGIARTRLPKLGALRCLLYQSNDANAPASATLASLLSERLRVDTARR